MNIFWFEFEKLMKHRILMLFGVSMIFVVLFRCYTSCLKYDYIDSKLFNDYLLYYENLTEEEAVIKAEKDCDGLSFLALRAAAKEAGMDDSVTEMLTSAIPESYGLDYNTFLQEYEDYAEGKDVNSSFAALSELLTQLKYRSTYKSFIEELPERAEILTQFQPFSGEDSFIRRNIDKSVRDYRKMTSVKIQPGENRGVLALSEDMLIIVFLMLFVLSGAVILYSEERDTGMIQLLITQEKGRTDLIWAKSSVLAFFSCGMTAIVYVGRLIIAAEMFGFGDLSRSLQSVSFFRDCCMKISIGEYLACSILLPMVSMLLFSMMVSLFFVLFSQAAVSGAAVLSMGVISYLLYQMVEDHSTLNILRYLNFFAIADTGSLFRLYGNVNLFGYPLSVIPTQMVFSGVIITGLSLLTAVLFNRRTSIHLPVYLFLQRRVRIRGSVSLFRHEIFRIAVLFGGIALLAGFLYMNGNRVKKDTLYLSDEKYIYYSFGQEIAGEIDENTDIWLEEKRLEIENAAETFGPISGDGDNQSTENATIMNMAQARELMMKQKAFQKIEIEVTKLKTAKERGIPVHYISEIQTDPLFNEGYSAILVWLILMFSLCVSFCPVFSCDRDSGMGQLVRVSEKGQEDVFIMRHLAMLSVYTFSFLLFLFPPVYNMLHYYRFRDFSAPIQSVLSYVHLQGDISIRAVLILKEINSFLAGIGMIEVMSYLSVLTKRRSTTLVVACMIIAADFLVSILKVPVLSWTVFSSGFSLSELLKSADDVFAGVWIGVKNLLLTSGLFVLHLHAIRRGDK